MNIFIINECDYDYSETHTTAFTNRAAAEKYVAKTKAKMDAEYAEQMAEMKKEYPLAFEGDPDTHPHQLFVHELELVDNCPG